MEYLTPKMVGDKLHIGMNKVYRLFKRPDFPCIRIGNQKLVESQSLTQYLKEYEGSSIKLA